MAATSSSDADVTVSEELFAPVSPEVELCYQTFGDPADQPVLLVMGLGGPMTWWNEGFCRMLAARGCYVIRFDNRDTGRSSRGTGRVTRTALVRAFAGLRVRPPYSLGDLAADAFGLLDHLGLDSAHLVGISMGGMIAQVMAIEQPSRVRTLTSIMSTTGKRTVGWQHPRLLPTLLKPAGTDAESYAARSLMMSDLIGSPAFKEPREEAVARAHETFERGFTAAGVLRQMLAILTEPDRGPRLRGLRVPALVIHGQSDRMVHVSGGRATARAIPGAELLLIEGLGHDLPRELHGTVVDAVARTVARA